MNFIIPFCAASVNSTNQYSTPWSLFFVRFPTAALGFARSTIDEQSVVPANFSAEPSYDLQIDALRAVISTAFVSVGRLERQQWEDRGRRSLAHHR